MERIRVALCLSGHLRTYVQVADSIKKYLIDALDCDVFIHTWDKIGFSRYDGDTNERDTNNELDIINELFKPKSIVVENSKPTVNNIDKYLTRSISRESPLNVFGMYYKIKMANELKKEYEEKNNFIYDLVIRSRADLMFLSYIPKFELENTELLWIPNFDMWGGTNDQFAFSSSKNMDIYSSLYDYIDSYWEDGVVFHPETLLDHHIEKNNLIMGPSEISFKIIRPTNIKP